jgi:hypothetical protein
MSFAAWRFRFCSSLEAVKDKHRRLELHGVDGAIGVACVVLDHFQNAAAPKAFQNLRRRVLVAVLRKIQGMPEEPHHADGKRD